MDIQIKRVYQQKEKSDGIRILVDRIWPRGVSKKDADLDEWMKEVAPSPNLRKWFNHDPERFEVFKKKYKQELDQDEEKMDALAKIRDYLKNEKVTLLYAAKDERHNHAVVLKEYLAEH